MNKLKPCPFCGSANVVEFDGSESQAQAIYCLDCPSGMADSRLSAKVLRINWNTRPLENKLLAALEKLSDSVQGMSVQQYPALAKAFYEAEQVIANVKGES